MQLAGEGNGNLLQYSCLENSMFRGAWWATVHGVTKSWTQLSTAQQHALRRILWPGIEPRPWQRKPRNLLDHQGTPVLDTVDCLSNSHSYSSSFLTELSADYHSTKQLWALKGCFHPQFQEKDPDESKPNLVVSSPQQIGLAWPCLVLPRETRGEAGLSFWENFLSRESHPRNTGFFFFFCCAMRHAGSWFPNQGSNPYTCRGSVDSQPLDHQGSPRHWILNVWVWDMEMLQSFCYHENAELSQEERWLLFSC